MNALNQVSSPMTLFPAYGRQYKNSGEMLQDWAQGKDFKIANGPYTSIRDISALVEQCSSLWLQNVPGGFSVRVV